MATYLIIKKYDAATKEAIKEPVVRRFGYRLDSVKGWQPVNWQSFYAQATEMDKIEALTDDLDSLLRDLAKNNRVGLGAYSNPVIKNRIDAWTSARSHRLSPRDLASVNQNFIAFLKVACQSDVAAEKPRVSYDYFQRALADHQRARNEIAEVFDRIIKDIQTDR